MATSNQNNYLKICIKGKVEKISYCPLPLYYSVLQNTIKEFIPNESLSDIRVYWIDEDGDYIDVDESKAYTIFLERSNVKKIFVETKEKQANKATFMPTTESRSSSAQQDKTSNEKVEHDNVECDACGVSPIVGFRYKCVQCPNFDLCMECEGKMLHKQHAMFRIPVPLERSHFHRSFFKKMKKGCFMRNDPESEDNPRHGRHHRRGRQNFFSALYTMMNDLAEGTDGPNPEQEQETTAQNTTDKEKQKNEAKTENKQDQNEANSSTGNQQSPGWQPYYEQMKQHYMQNMQQNPQGWQYPCDFKFDPQTCPLPTMQNPTNPQADVKIDPNYAKSGIQIMKNFSEMFAKMLDPLGINLEVDIDLKDNKNKNESSNAGNEEQQESAAEKRKDSKESTPVAETSNDNANVSEKSSLNQEQKTPDAQEKKRDSINEETWTLIDKNAEEKSPPPTVAVAEEGAVGVDKNAEKPQPATNDVNYTKLSQDLWQHIKKEEKKPEMRAQIVYHEKPHINNAVIAMTAMGFSNEGQWLTHLLESVDGDISQALDLMKPVK